MGSGKSHETLKRQWLLLKRMPRRSRKGTKHFQAELKDMGFEVSLRTIQRDLNDLSRFFPLQCDEERTAGWKWAEDAAVFEVPGMEPHVALAFKMLEMHLDEMLPGACSDFLNPYYRRADQVLSLLGEKRLTVWPEKIARISRHYSLAAPEVNNEVLARIFDAVFQEKQLELTYRNRADKETLEGIVHPLALVFVDQVAYLVCTFWKYQEIRKLALHRILEVTILDEDADQRPDFHLSEYVQEGNFGLPQESDQIILKCLFDPEVAKHLRESPLNDTQAMNQHESLRVQLTATIKETAQLHWWLLGFGEKVEILEPKHLREKIGNILTKASTQYQ